MTPTRRPTRRAAPARRRSRIRKVPTTFPIATRHVKVQLDAFAVKPASTDSFVRFWDGLPRLLGAQALKEVVGAIAQAREKGRPVVFAFGAHVLKVGLGPTLIDLIRRGFVTGLATNGASGIHDFEIAYHGKTSEDVGSVLQDGEFGMSRETGLGVFRALRAGRPKGWGYGRALGEHIARSRYPYRDQSLFAAAAKAGVPLTVHVAIGTDTLAQHPGMDGALVGELSTRDFKTAVQMVATLGDGGVWINAGSSVILPEVFLKALSLARNLGHDVRDFTTVDLDMIRHYRPSENVLKRPTMAGGRSYAITGHHEILLPLIAQALVLGIGVKW
jgi:hypothetical protein